MTGLLLGRASAKKSHFDRRHKKPRGHNVQGEANGLVRLASILFPTCWVRAWRKYEMISLALQDFQGRFSETITRLKSRASRLSPAVLTVVP